MITRLMNWLEGFTYYTCKGAWSDSTTDHGSEFCCEALYGDINCADCLCQGGMYNPDTGRKDFIRHFFINHVYPDKEEQKMESKKDIDCKNYDTADDLCSNALLKNSHMKCPYRDGYGDKKNCPKYQERASHDRT